MSCGCSIAQVAAAKTLIQLQTSVQADREWYRRRRDLVLFKIERIPGLKCTPPGGTFYAFVDWRESMGRSIPAGVVISDDESLCNYLLHEFGLAVVPGAAFGAPGFFRMSFASAEDTLQEGMRRVRAGMASLAD